MKAIFKALLPFALVLPLFAQQGDGLERGFAEDKVYDFDGVDSINTYNGNLTITLPIGPAYPVNGGLSYGLSLTYNSKVWDYESYSGGMRAVPNRRANAGMAWSVSPGRIVSPLSATNDADQWIYESPDGNEHIFFDKLHDSDGATSFSSPILAVRYTRDGTYLRMIARNDGTTDVEFPNGQVHTFNTASGNLTAIRDLTRSMTVPGRTANSVQVTYLTSSSGTPCSVGSPFVWQFTDSESARSNYVCFKSMATPQSIFSGIVDRIILAAPPTSTGTARNATFVFNHTATTIQRGCHSQGPSGTTIPSVPMLTSVTRPDGSSFTFDYNYNSSAIGSCDQGTLKSMTLPTGAKYEYAYRYFFIPNDQCSHQQFNTRVIGVASKKITHSTLPAAEWTYDSTLSASPGQFYAYCTADGPLAQVDAPAEEMKVTVKDPLGNRTEYFYSVWPGADGFTSPSGFLMQESGLPFTRKQKRTFTTGGSVDAYLSMREYSNAGYLASPKQPLRSTYLTYEQDIAACYANSHSCTNVNSRMNRQVVVYHDDSDVAAETKWSDFDGLGHYRTEVNAGAFTGNSTADAQIETYTAFNKRETNVNPSNGINTGTYVPGGAFTPPGGFTPWVINTSSSTKTTQGSSSVLMQTCYDDATGALRATRAASVAQPQGTSSDLVTVFTRDGQGNVTKETFFGADDANAPPSTSLCAIAALTTFPTPNISREHTYQWGVLKTSKYTGASFFNVNRTIDRYTGAVLTATDSAGYVTTFGYDDKFRITSLTPPGVAATTMTYSNATASTPAKVLVSSSSTGSGTTQAEFQYDAEDVFIVARHISRTIRGWFGKHCSTPRET